MSGATPCGAAIAFVNREARLLDEGRFEEWLALFADDGVYWIPATAGQTDPDASPSIIHEGPALLALRVARLRHPHAYALLPPPRTLHLVGTADCEDGGAAGSVTVRSSLIVVEQQDERRRLFGGACRHLLRRAGDGFRIVLKRIDLVDCDAAHEPILSLL